MSDPRAACDGRLPDRPAMRWLQALKLLLTVVLLVVAVWNALTSAQPVPVL